MKIGIKILEWKINEPGLHHTIKNYLGYSASILEHKEGSYIGLYTLTIINDFIGSFLSLEDAKEFAQRDFESMGKRRTAYWKEMADWMNKQP